MIHLWCFLVCLQTYLETPHSFFQALSCACSLSWRVCLITLPIVLATTTAAGLPPEPFVLTLMMAASASFATPIGYQTNLMIYGPGGFQFNDFLKAGIPLNIICGILTVAVVTFWYPM